MRRKPSAGFFIFHKKYSIKKNEGRCVKKIEKNQKKFFGIFDPKGPHISARGWNIKNPADDLRLICQRAQSLKLHRYR